MHIYAKEDFYRLQQAYWWFVARRYIIAKMLRKKYGARKGLRIADIGCGSSAMFNLLSNFGKVYAADLFYDVLKFAAEKHPAFYSQADISQLCFRPDAFDLICCFDSLEHSDDDMGVLRSFYASCKPGGRIILTVPAFTLLWGQADYTIAESEHKRRYVRKSLAAKVRAVGFKIEKISYMNSFLFPLSLLRYLLAGPLRIKINKDGDLPLFPPLINKLLCAIFMSEAFWLQYVNLPVGSSLLCLAKKPGDSLSASKTDLQRIKEYWQKKSENFERYYRKPTNIFTFFVHAFLEKRMAKILSLLEPVNCQKILDLGCGCGSFMAVLSGENRQITGVDYSYSMLLAAKGQLEQANIKYYNLVLADAERIALRDNYYDIVLCTGVLDYILDTKAVLRGIRRVLKDSGRAVVTIPCQYSPFFFLRYRFGNILRQIIFGLPPILTVVTRAQMFEMLEESGLRVEYTGKILQTMWVFFAKPRVK